MEPARVEHACAASPHNGTTASVTTADAESHQPKKPLRILCLDGGGIRGVILIEILKAISKQLVQKTGLSQPIRRYFDVIGGTSTGGILACALAREIELDECTNIYRSMASKVFSGSQLPYDEKPLEKLLKEKFGADTKLSEIDESTHLIITSVRANINPPQLYLFTNYSGEESAEYPIWKAARATSAAPGFFKAFDKMFQDGGTMANNPTLDVLARIGRKEDLRRVNGGVLVSLGTGEQLATSRHIVDLDRPDNFIELVKSVYHAKDMAKEISVILTGALSRGGHAVERATVWCNMIGMFYHRISPIVCEEIPLDCKDLHTIDSLIEETRRELDTEDMRIRVAQIADELLTE